MHQPLPNGGHHWSQSIVAGGRDRRSGQALAKHRDTAAINAAPKADRAQVDYDALCIGAFKKASYGEVKPRIDVLTFNRWLEKGCVRRKARRPSR